MEPLVLRLWLEAAHLLRPAAHLRDLARPHLGGLVICHVHHGEPAKKLLGLDVWSVGDQQGCRFDFWIGELDRFIAFGSGEGHPGARQLGLEDGERFRPNSVKCLELREWHTIELREIGEAGCYEGARGWTPNPSRKGRRLALIIGHVIRMPGRVRRPDR